MLHYIEDGKVVTGVGDTDILYSENQLAGFEQFVAASEVVIEEELPAYTNYIEDQYSQIPPMTSNGKPFGEVYSSINIESKIKAYTVFSDDDSNVLKFDGGTGFIKYDAQRGIHITHYTILAPYGESSDKQVRSWTVFGSDDDRNWVVIDRRFKQNIVSGTLYSFTCQAPHTFRYIKFVWTENGGGVYTALALLKFYGTSVAGFDVKFDLNMPVIMYHTEHQQEVGHFSEVYPNSIDETDPFGDGSQIAYYKLQEDLLDTCGNYDLHPKGNAPIFGEDATGKYLNLISNYNDSFHTATKIPVSTFDGVTICGFIRSPHTYYSYEQYVWALTKNYTSYSGDPARDDAIQQLKIPPNSQMYQINVLADNSSLHSESGVNPAKYNDWKFVVIRQTGNRYELLIDGKVLTGLSTYKTTNTLIDSYFTLGVVKRRVRQHIKSVRIFNRWLNDEEIFKIYSVGKTLAFWKDRIKPLAFTILDSAYYLNNKRLSKTLTGVEILREREKFRYVHYELRGGNSIDNTTAIVEVAALDDNFNNLALGAAVKVERVGNGKKDVITDGDTNSSKYYSSNTSTARVLIDLGEKKPIRYIQSWNYYSDYRYYKGVYIKLTNNPLSIDWDDGYYTQRTDVSGYYVETEDGRITSNLSYTYTFRCKYFVSNVVFPPLYKYEFKARYLREGSKLVDVNFDINRNLWHLVPRVTKVITEMLSASESSNIVFPKKVVVVENASIQELILDDVTPFNNTSEVAAIKENTVVVTTQGTPNSEVESTSIFESVSTVLSNPVVKTITEVSSIMENTEKRYTKATC
jgi:hypothetical protein